MTKWTAKELRPSAETTALWWLTSSTPVCRKSSLTGKGIRLLHSVYFVESRNKSWLLNFGLNLLSSVFDNLVNYEPWIMRCWHGLKTTTRAIVMFLQGSPGGRGTRQRGDLRPALQSHRHQPTGHHQGANAHCPGVRWQAGACGASREVWLADC